MGPSRLRPILNVMAFLGRRSVRGQERMMERLLDRLLLPPQEEETDEEYLTRIQYECESFWLENGQCFFCHLPATCDCVACHSPACEGCSHDGCRLCTDVIGPGPFCHSCANWSLYDVTGKANKPCDIDFMTRLRRAGRDV